MSPSRKRLVLPIVLLLGLCVAFMPGFQQRAHATGSYLVVVNGAPTGAANTYSATLPAGASSAVEIMGYNFTPNLTGSVSVTTNAGAPGVIVSTNSAGTFTSPAYFPVGATPSGSYTYSAFDSQGDQPSVLLNLTVGGTGTGGSCGVNSAGTSLGVSPTTVAPGGVVTFFGSGFQPSTTVTLSGGPSATTDTGGSFSLAYTVPTGANGVYSITALDGFNHTACTVLTVSGTGTSGTAVLSVNQPTTVTGQQVTVSGSGFNTSGTVTVSGPGITTTPVALGSNGAFSAALTTILNTATGTYTLTATDGTHTASTTYSLVNGTGIAAVTAAPSTVAAGGQISFTGSGFSGNTAAEVILSGTGITTQFIVQTGSGTFGPTAVTIAAGTPNGAYTITASDGTKTATTVITVGTSTTSGVTLSAIPSNIAAGQAVTLNGAGFTPNAGVSISGANTAASVTANPSGAFSTPYTIPAGTAAGSYLVTATDTSGRVGTFTIRVGATGITITPSVSSGTPGQAVPFSLTGFSPNEQVVVSLANTATPATAIAGTSQTLTADANGNLTGSYTIPALAAGSYSLFVVGQTSLTVAYATFSVLATTPTAIPTTTTPVAQPTAVPAALPAVSSGPATTIFAEGNTGSTANGGKLTFSEKLYLYNPGTASSTVNITYYVYATGATTATTVTASDTVAAGSTVVRSVNNDAGNNKFVSIVVQANPGIVAETAISRVNAAGAQLDSDSSTGSSSLQQNWYLAEGYTGASIQEYITLFNPGNTAASTQVSYLPSDSQAPAPQAVSVPAQGRVTINVRSVYNALVPHGSRNVAISVSSSVPIAVDRSIYWGNGSGSAKYGYSLGPAISSGKTSQSFAFLPTEAGSQAFVTVLNPGTSTANATLTLRALGAITLGTFSASIPAGKRYTFTVPNLLHGDQGAIVGLLTSSLPVVAEGSLYFNGSPNIGNHPGLVIQGTTGSNVGARATVSPNGAQLRLFNPGTTIERVQVTLGSASGSSVAYDSTLPGGLARSITLPPGTDPRGISIRASGTVEAVLINGGDGAALAWGGTLN